MTIYNRTAFKKHVETGRLTLNKGEITFFNKPSGALCTIELAGNMPNLRNGESRMVNDALSQELVKRGITGDVIIHHKKLSRNVSKWIGHALHKLHPSEYMTEIVIYSFGAVPTGKGDYPDLEIRQLLPEKSNEHDIGKVVRAASVDDDYDGALIVGNTQGKPYGSGHDWYHILPVRRTHGNVVGIVPNPKSPNLAGLIVNVWYKDGFYETVIRSIPKWMTGSDYYRYRNELIGKKAEIEFTAFTAGDRLKNFSSVVVLSVS